MSRSGKSALVVLAVIVLGIAAYFFLTRGNGGPEAPKLGFYTVNPVTKEIMVTDKAVVDAFGQPSKRIGFTMAVETYFQKHNKQYPSEEIPFSQLKVFFDRRSGDPLVYFSRDQLGFHFFLKPGHSPVTGLELQPINPGVVLACQRAQALLGQPREQDETLSYQQAAMQTISRQTQPTEGSTPQNGWYHNSAPAAPPARRFGTGKNTYELAGDWDRPMGR